MGNENAKTKEVRDEEINATRRKAEAQRLLDQVIEMVGRDEALDLLYEIRHRQNEDAWTGLDRMIFLPGPGQDSPETRRSFRCECGANVFRQDRFQPLRYRCNGCGAIYIGE
jgi:hypothetical protein